MLQAGVAPEVIAEKLAAMRAAGDEADADLVAITHRSHLPYTRVVR